MDNKKSLLEVEPTFDFNLHNITFINYTSIYLSCAKRSPKGA